MRGLTRSYVKPYVDLVRDRNMCVLLLSSVALSLFRGPIAWILPLVLMEKGGPLLVGASFAAANVDDTFFAFLGGFLGDRYGRKPVMIASAALYCVGCLLLILSLLLHGLPSQVVVFLATVFLYGMTGVSSGPGQAIIAESADEQNLGRAFSLLSLSSVAARALGSAALGFVYMRTPVGAAIVALVLSLAALAARFFLRETLDGQSHDRHLSFRGHMAKMVGTIRSVLVATFIPLVVIVVSNGLAHGLSGNYYPPYFRTLLDLDEATIGVVYSVMAVVQAFILPLAGWFADRFGFSAVLAVGNVGAGLAVLVFALSGSRLVALSATVISGGLGVFHGIGQSVAIAKLTDRSFRSTLYGATDASWNAMFVLGPFIGGLLYALRPTSLFIVAAVLLLATAVPTLALRRVAHSHDTRTVNA